MEIKHYKIFKIIIAMAVAMIISESVVTNNYILAVVSILTAMAVMLIAKKKVKGVLADERDYEIAGKSARYAMSIFSVASSILALYFMSLRISGQAYETIGSVLAYSACAQLLLYSLIFKYYEKQN